MNSHTKPRHENKQDLIYLLPVSQQMPGWAGGALGEGGRGATAARAWHGKTRRGSPPLCLCISNPL